MRLVVAFDINADIIDVPQSVINNKDALRKKFLKWLYNKKNKHNYWRLLTDSKGKQFWVLQYRADAFVEWLNNKILSKEELAVVIARETNEYPNSLPKIIF